MRAALAIATMLMSSGAAAGAHACSPPGDPAEWADQQERIYLSEVTGIYVGTIQDLTGTVDSGAAFTVRRTSDIWGEPGADRLQLHYEAGACSNYLVLWLEDFTGQPLEDGVAVRVFVTPAAKLDPARLYVVPEGGIAEGMMDRWHGHRSDH